MNTHNDIVEEKVKEFEQEFTSQGELLITDDGSYDDITDWLRTALTEAYTRGYEEGRESVVEEINRRLEVQKKVMHSEYEGGYTHALQDIKEVALT